MMPTEPLLARIQKSGSQTFYTWGLKSIHQSYNINTYLPIIATNYCY